MGTFDFGNHPLLSDYLEEVSTQLVKAGTPSDEREGILADLRVQIAEMADGRRLGQREQEVVLAKLSPPGSFGESVGAKPVTRTESARNGSAMKIFLGFLAVFLVLGLGVLFWGMSRQRLMARQLESVQLTESQVEAVLQRRFDLIPNLVRTVRGYAAHEKEILTEVTTLRTQWAAAQDPGQRNVLGQALSASVGRLLAVAENYPNLKADQTFRDLMVALEGAENRISVERMRYNQAIASYNSQILGFPDRFIANLFGFETREGYFESQAGASEPPSVNFE